MKNTSTSAFKGVSKVVHAENVCPLCSARTIQDQMTRYEYREICTSCEWVSNGDFTWQFGDRCSVKNVLPMTGSPILNKPQDLFAMLNLVDPVMFDTEKSFLYSYCQEMWIGNSLRWGFRPGGLDSLTKKLGGKFIARDRHSAGVVWPEQDIEVHDIDFDRETYEKQWEVIDKLQNHAAILMDDGVVLPILYQIALITRQRQANVWPGGIEIKHPETGDILWKASEHIQESMKIDKVVEMCNEITAEGSIEMGDRIVIFSQFKTALAETEKRLRNAGISVVRYDGDTAQGLRNEIQLDFDRTHCDQPGYQVKWQVVLCNFKTGGQGLNFTGASEMIIMDEEWNPGKNDQAYGRIDRLGQVKKTKVNILRFNKTIDTWMAALIEQKADMINGFESAQDLQSMLLKLMREDS